MEGVVFKLFGVIFRFIGFLLVTGTIVTALHDIQEKAFQHKRVGLVSLLQVNQQLVGKTK